MEIALCKWPTLIWSLPLSDAAKRKLHSSQPWRHPLELLFWRGSGLYSYSEYRRWIRPQLGPHREKLIPFVCAVMPRALANLVAMIPLWMRRERLRQLQGLKLEVLRRSPSHWRNWGWRSRQPADAALTPDLTRTTN
jgi:hypothetical protein